MIKIGETAQLDAAQVVALAQARDYLRKQLMQNSPNISTIYTTVKSHVDAQPILQRMVSNEIALARLAYAWPVLGILTDTDKARYLMAVQNVIALLGN